MQSIQLGTYVRWQIWKPMSPMRSGTKREGREPKWSTAGKKGKPFKDDQRVNSAARKALRTEKCAPN